MTPGIQDGFNSVMNISSGHCTCHITKYQPVQAQQLSKSGPVDWNLQKGDTLAGCDGEERTYTNPSKLFLTYSISRGRIVINFQLSKILFRYPVTN